MSKSKFNTNGVLINRLNGVTVNIITTKKMADLVEALAFISVLRDSYTKANESLNGGIEFNYNGYSLDAWSRDIEFAAKRLQARTTTTTTTSKMKEPSF
jgi:hypothetical protein